MRESILELFNFNTFDLLQKQLKSYQRAQSKYDTELKSAQQEYETISNELTALKDTKDYLSSNIEKWLIELDNLEADQLKLDQEFRQRGGLLEAEQNLLNSTITQLENERTELNLYIRDFSNNELPFLLLPKHLNRLISQINKEQELMEYKLFQDKLQPDLIRNSISRINELNVSNQDSLAITNYILDNLFNRDQLKDINEILGLSKEQAHAILSLCTSIQEHKSDYSEKIQQKYKRLDRIATLLKEAKIKLNSTVSHEQLMEYMSEVNKLTEQRTKLRTQIDHANAEIIKTEEKLTNLTLTYTKARNKMIELLQNSNISNISLELINYFDELLATVTKKKIKLIEKEFISIFKQIIRKDNFIDDIKLDENFNATLYIYKDYTVTELVNICNNLGTKNLVYKYGELFIDDLYKAFDADESNILDHLWRHELISKTYKLHTKINISLLSSGEKQVYVLCLIWAILKVSNVDLPFIIDTPYARIDTTHRNALTTLYLPNISKQVIILSTNEEIDHELYKTLKPYIANEHLLIYNNVTRKTTTKNTYFEV